MNYALNGIVDKKDDYVYGAQNRLVTSSYTGYKDIRDDLFNLDNLDNITSGFVNGKSVNNQLKDSVRIDQNNGDIFSYDTRGNVTSDGLFSYEWDAFDRLLKAEKINNNLEEGEQPVYVKYTYDGLGRRILRQYAGIQDEKVVDTHCIYNGVTLIEERLWSKTIANEHIFRRFVYGSSINEPILVEEENDFAYSNNSVTDILDKIYVPVLDDRGTLVGVINGKPKS